LILDFVAHCRSISPEFAVQPEFQPTKLLGRLMHGEKIRDDALAVAITRLVDMGASLSQEVLDKFKRTYRHFRSPKSYQVYHDLLHPQLKEPAT
jgi:hypothetical protein